MSGTRRGLGLVILVVLTAAPACGGGGGGDDPPGPGTTTTPLFSTASLDGYVTSSGQAFAGGPNAPWAGDIDDFTPNMSANAYYSFPLGGIPAGAVFVGAVVQVSVTSSMGNPYAAYGNLRAWYVPYGNDLANVVGMMIVNPPPYAMFSPADDSTGVKEANVTDILHRAVSDGHDRLQIGVGFAGPSNNDGVGQWVHLTDAENTSGSQPPPRLVVTWHLP